MNLNEIVTCQDKKISGTRQQDETAQKVKQNGTIISMWKTLKLARIWLFKNIIGKNCNFFGLLADHSCTQRIAAWKNSVFCAEMPQLNPKCESRQA